jgi:hypothetical protein
MKACPFNDIDTLQEPHFQAGRKDIEQRLEDECEMCLDSSSPQRDLFKRTAAYIATLRNQGCTRPLSAVTVRSEAAQEEFEEHQARLEHYRRGYIKPETCQGRIMYKKSGTKPYLMYLFLPIGL